jgi:hypothetical protein
MICDQSLTGSAKIEAIQNWNFLFEIPLQDEEDFMKTVTFMESPIACETPEVLCKEGLI